MIRRIQTPLLQAIGLLPRLGWQFTMIFWMLVAAAGVLPVVFIVLTGRLIGVLEASSVSRPLESTREVLVWLAWLSSLHIAQQALTPLQEALAASGSLKFGTLLRTRVLKSMLRPIHVNHLEDPDVSNQLVLSQGLFDQQFVNALSQIASARVQGVLCALLLFRFRWWTPLVMVAASLLTRRWMYREFDTLQTTRSASPQSLRRAGYFRDLALESRPAKEVRIFGLPDWILENFSAHWLVGIASVWRERRAHRLLMAQGVIGLVGASGVVFLSIAVSATLGELGIGEVVILGQAVLGTMQLGWLGDSDWLLRESVSPIPHIRELEGRLRRQDSEPDEKTAQGLADLEFSAIRFENVTFCYPGSSRPVLSDINLTIEGGKSFALVGVNGAGKTTFVKLLARLHDPDDGRITVDGVDTRDFPVREWRRKLSVIFQDFVHYELSFRQNVTFGCLHSRGDDELLAGAVDLAGADEVLSRLAQGWDTILSRAYQDGIDISGGEWQKVALARALLGLNCGAKLLILDEPTSNLDVRAEAALFNRLLSVSQDLTTLLISHRLSSVRSADRICVLSDGSISEQGNHEELIQTNGIYARMFDLQARRFRNG